MSETLFDAATWAVLDRARQIRLAAVAVLQNYPTPAGFSVRDTPRDPYQLDLLPQIGVSSRETFESVSLAGGPPSLRVRCVLLIQCVGVSALPDDLTTIMDAYRATVLEALLADPVFPGMFEPIAGIQEKRGEGMQGERMIGDLSFELSISWQERYRPRTTSPLMIAGRPIGIIHQQRDVITPLRTAVITTEAGGHPQPETLDATGPAPGVPKPTEIIDLPQ